MSGKLQTFISIKLPVFNAWRISIPAIILIVLGILFVVSPWTIAPVCEVNGMFAQDREQQDSAHALRVDCACPRVGMGAVTILPGLLLMFSQSAETKRIIGLFGVALGVLTILFPLYITKMCALADRPCNLLTNPVLVILGIATIAVSCWVIYDAQKNMA